VLAWRDGRGRSVKRSFVRVATFDGTRFVSAPRTVGTDVSQIVFAARGSGAAVGWIDAFRRPVRKTRLSVPRARPRSLRIVALDDRGRPSGSAILAGRDIGSKARLAGSPDGRLVASWVRPQKIGPFPGEEQGSAPPPSAYVNPVAFTRQLLPTVLAARPLAVPFPAGVPSVAFDAPGHAVAALRAPTPGGSPPAFDAVTAAAAGGGPWSTPALAAHVGFSNFDPVVVAPSAGAVVICSALLPNPGPPAWAVLATDAGGARALGTTNGPDGRGIAVARGGDRVLVAWPSTTGGVQVAEQG